MTLENSCGERAVFLNTEHQAITTTKSPPLLSLDGGVSSPVECGSSVEVAVAPSPRPLPFMVGERVRVVVSVDELRTMQEGHGGWNHKMAEVG